MTAATRTAELLQAALDLAEAEGWAGLTRARIAARAGVSEALVSVRLGTVTELRRNVMRAAVQRRVLRVVAEGLVCGDKHARRADAALKAAAQEWLVRA